MIVYVGIGNSDHKLSQHEWASFWMRTALLLTNGSNRQVHGEWLSSPQARYQNACWCIEIKPNDLVVRRDGLEVTVKEWLQGALRDLAREYRQDSIAWTEVREVTFLSHEDEKGYTP